ncbi:MAG: dihydroxy-acid dehydratase [Acidimicrobiales bacterium]
MTSNGQTRYWTTNRVELRAAGFDPERARALDLVVTVSHGILIGHVSPEVAVGGPIAAVVDDDTIVIDPTDRTVTLAVDDEVAARMARWSPPPSTVPPGSVRHKYARFVSSAHYGCVQ